MLRFTKALQAWGTPDFDAALKAEVAQMDPSLLPLQQGLSRSSYAKTDKLDVVVLGCVETAQGIDAKVGIFYAGIIPGCACADDPTPESDYTEYCEVRFHIDRDSAETTVSLLGD